MNQSDNIAAIGYSKQIDLETYKDIDEALKKYIVFADLIKGKGARVSDVRKFTHKSLDRLSSKDPEWTSRHAQGTAKGYEVLTLEGWSVPERVYYVTREKK